MGNDIYQHIGRRIREERIKRGWTQEHLAEKVGLHLSFIGQLERGFKKPSVQTVKNIATIFGIKAGALFDEELPAQKPYPLEKRFTDLVRDRSKEQQDFLYQTLRQLIRQSRKISGR